MAGVTSPVDDHGGVFGAVVCPMERPEIVECQRLQLGRQPTGGCAIAMRRTEDEPRKGDLNEGGRIVRRLQ